LRRRHATAAHERLIVSTLIIAEAGVNHNGDPAVARRLIDVAAEAGADLVKFQTFSADRLVTATAERAGYQTANCGGAESQHAMLRRLELTPTMHRELLAYCGTRAIGFFSSAFDIESLDLLASLGLDRFKIPSGEITNLPYLQHVGGFGKPLIMSTGMASMDEIGAALAVLESAGTARQLITVLHCNTQYPTRMGDVNLRAMLDIRDTFDVQVGYSDHTLGMEIAIAAVALGATVIEKHFTLDRKMSGPDHKASLEPLELAAMVAAIRNVEQALGDGIKRPSASELPNRAAARKSLVAACVIHEGEPFTAANIAVKRPGTGLSPMQFDAVLGRKAPRNFLADELIEL
jgi:N,N'-diacetyllegionaminate synthase